MKNIQKYFGIKRKREERRKERMREKEAGTLNLEGFCVK